VLPFTGLNAPAGVAVDTAGNLYVTDGLNNQVLKLPAG
jgi:serine/threonine-protein kinase